MSKAAKLVSSAIIGADVAIVVINSKQYVIQPPTIHRLAGCISVLTRFELSDEPTLAELLGKFDDKSLSEALSWLIKGDGSLAEELSHGTYEEVLNGVSKGISLISAQVFYQAVSLARSVALLAARPKS
jgi:hypothetical protein